MCNSSWHVIDLLLEAFLRPQLDRDIAVNLSFSFRTPLTADHLWEVNGEGKGNGNLFDRGLGTDNDSLDQTVELILKEAFGPGIDDVSKQVSISFSFTINLPKVICG